PPCAALVPSTPLSRSLHPEPIGESVRDQSAHDIRTTTSSERNDVGHRTRRISIGQHARSCVTIIAISISVVRRCFVLHTPRLLRSEAHTSELQSRFDA